MQLNKKNGKVLLDFFLWGKYAKLSLILFSLRETTLTCKFSLSIEFPKPINILSLVVFCIPGTSDRLAKFLPILPIVANKVVLAIRGFIASPSAFYSSVTLGPNHSDGQSEEKDLDVHLEKSLPENLRFNLGLLIICNVNYMYIFITMNMGRQN